MKVVGVQYKLQYSITPLLVVTKFTLYLSESPSSPKSPERLHSDMQRFYCSRRIQEEVNTPLFPHTPQAIARLKDFLFSLLSRIRSSHFYENVHLYSVKVCVHSCNMTCKFYIV